MRATSPSEQSSTSATYTRGMKRNETARSGQARHAAPSTPTTMFMALTAAAGTPRARNTRVRCLDTGRQSRCVIPVLSCGCTASIASKLISSAPPRMTSRYPAHGVGDARLAGALTAKRTRRRAADQALRDRPYLDGTAEEIEEEKRGQLATMIAD